FSSRRRHTRSKRDWSSDVCSSDLLLLFLGNDLLVVGVVPLHQSRGQQQAALAKDHQIFRESDQRLAVSFFQQVPHFMGRLLGNRSEERRVGKECSARWLSDACIKI